MTIPLGNKHLKLTGYYQPGYLFKNRLVPYDAVEIFGINGRKKSDNIKIKCYQICFIVSKIRRALNHL